MSEYGIPVGRRRVVIGLLAGTCIPALHASPRRSALTLPAIVYDQGMGSTDATGLVKAFPLRGIGAKQIFVDAKAGSIHFNGLSPYQGQRLDGMGENYQVGARGPGKADTAFGPAASYAQAIEAIRPIAPEGEGWQVFLAEGQSFEVGLIRNNWAYLHGHSVDYPFCLQSYDPRDPLNLDKHGRAGTTDHQARPVLLFTEEGSLPIVARGDARAYNNWVFRGLRLASRATTSPTIGHVYCVNNFLIENCVLESVQLTLENNNPHEGFQKSGNIIVRRVSSFGQYDIKGSHACGVYSSNVDITIEDSVFYHCGWKIGTSRGTPVSAGGPDMFKHCLYIHGGNGTSAVIRRVVMVDASAAGLSLRGNHLCHHNVFIDCPTADFKGGGSASDSESPSGVVQKAFCHLIMGGADIAPSLPRGQGFSCSDGTRDSYYMYSLSVNNPNFGQVNNAWLMVNGQVSGQHSYMRLVGNRAYAYAPASRRLVLGGKAPETIRIIDEDNLAQDESAVSNNIIYNDIGYRGKSDLVNNMIANPMKDWSYDIIGVASKRFAFDFGRLTP